MTRDAITAAIDLICATPNYGAIGWRLAQLTAKNRLRVDLNLEARAETSLRGIITLGPEAIASNPVSLAQTLVHEAYHVCQNPFLKTVSFWSGVATRTPIMRRYEQPAYQAALDFLSALQQVRPDLAAEVEAEQNAVRCVFANDFGVMLR